MTTRDSTAPRAAAAEPRGGPFSPAYRLITVALVSLVTITAFEFMAVATAMPRAAKDLDAISSYALAFSVMLTTSLLGVVLAGVWSDRSGPMPGMYAGTLLFAAGAAVCGLATSFPVFLAGRAVTGLGAGLVLVVLYVVIGRVYPTGTRPRVFSYVSAAWVLPSLVGAPVAGWLAGTFSWRLVFWVVVAPALLTLGVVARQAHAIRTEGDRTPVEMGERREHRRTARLGVLVAGAAGLVQYGTHERVSALSPQAFAAAAGVIGLLVLTPRLLPAGTLAMARGLPSVILSRFLLNAAFNGSITFIPLMFVQERGSSLTTAGAVLAVGSLGWSAGSWVQGQRSMHHRRHRLVSAGAAFLAAGCAAMVVITVLGWSVWAFAPAMAFAGLGMGLASTSLSVLLLDLTPVAGHGRASSSLQLADVLGSVLGIAGAGALFVAMHATGGADDRHTYASIWAALAVVAALAVIGGQRSVRPRSAADRPRGQPRGQAAGSGRGVSG